MARALSSRAIAFGREFGRAGQAGPSPRALLGALIGVVAIILASMLPAVARPALASDEPAPPVIRVPGDYPLPGPGERVVIPVPVGGQVSFDLAVFDPGRAQVSADGADMVLRWEHGGELVLAGMFASLDPPALIVLGEATISAEMLLAQILALAGTHGPPREGGAGPAADGGDETAVPADVPLAQALALAATGEGPLETEAGAGPMAGGGGELAGLLQVVSWLLDRFDLVSETQAAELPQLAQNDASGSGSRFAQLKAQLLIARETEILELAKSYEALNRNILAALKERLAGGGGSQADVDQSRVTHLDAQLEVKAAEYRLALAIDAHQDAYGKRLVTAAVPVWERMPPDDLAAITAALPATQHALARRYLRQARHSREAVALLETLSQVALQVRDAYVQQFEVAQRTLLDVQYADKTLFQSRVRLVGQQIDLLIAEAWLLDALGQLPAEHIKQPGWQ